VVTPPLSYRGEGGFAALRRVTVEKPMIGTYGTQPCKLVW
jgi:hypothetical protein